MVVGLHEDSPTAGAMPVTVRTHPSRRRVLAFVATLALAGVFIYLAVRGVHWHAAWRALERCDAWWLLPAMVAFALQTWMRAMRWRSLFDVRRRPSRMRVIEATLIGYLFNNVMPARAGEAARVVSLSQHAPNPAAEIVGTVVVERAYDVLSILIIFFCATPWLPHVSWLGAAAVLAGVAAAVLGGVIWILAVHGDRPIRVIARPLGRLPRVSIDAVEQHAAALARGLSGLRERRVALEALAWSLGAWLTSALWAWLVLLAFQPQLGFNAGILITVVIGLSMVIPAPPASVGVFEAAGVLALRAFHVSQTNALPFALVLHVSNFIPLVLAGLITLQFAARQPRRPVVQPTYTS